MAVTDYGKHPTNLSNLSDTELYAMYRSTSWSKMNNDERLELMQETVNRAAAERGEVGSQKVTFEKYTEIEETSNGPQVVPDMYTIAQNGPKGITVNSNLYEQGKDVTPWGQPDPAAGLHVLESLRHENEHAYQDQVIHDVIPAHDPAAAHQYKANDFTNTLILLDDGSLKTGSHYINAGTASYKSENYYLYYLSSTERDAFRFSQEKTAAIAEMQKNDILNEVNALMAKDPAHYRETAEYRNLAADYKGIQTYLTELEQNGYKSMVESAQNAFQDKNIEQNINHVLTNDFYHEKVDVPENVEKAVNEAMVLSYQIQTGTVAKVEPQNNAEKTTAQNTEEDQKTGNVQQSQSNGQNNALNAPAQGQIGATEQVVSDQNSVLSEQTGLSSATGENETQAGWITSDNGAGELSDGQGNENGISSLDPHSSSQNTGELSDSHDYGNMNSFDNQDSQSPSEGNDNDNGLDEDGLDL